MANTTFTGPVRSQNGFEVAVKNTDTGAFTVRQASFMPDITGLTFADTATATNVAIANNVIAAVNYTGAAACTVALPAAISGNIVVYVQSKDTAGGTAALTFNALGTTDAWRTGSLIESRAANEVAYDTSTVGEGKLTFTPADATTNLFTLGSMIAFQCFENGVWNISYKMAEGHNKTTGAFAFAA